MVLGPLLPGRDMDTRLITIIARSYKDDAYRALLEKKVFEHTYSAESVIVTLAVALSLYNCLELFLAIGTTFKKWRGLYFWSMLVSTFGVVLYALGMMLMYFELCVLWLSKVILDVGWIAMVVFQSLVLYSRLGLVLDSYGIMRVVRWMIIFNSISLVTLTVVFDFGTTYSANEDYPEGYYYIEHIQITVFCFQELVLSSLYIWKAADLLRLTQKARTRRTMIQLFIMNVVIVGMDIALIVLQYRHLQLYQEAIKVFVYSVKLKLELSILSKLADLVRDNRNTNSTTLNTIEDTTIEGQSNSEMLGSGRHGVSKWYVPHDPGKHATVSGAERRLNDGHRGRPEGSASPPEDINRTDDTGDNISNSHAGLQALQSPARTSGRESDMMYAEYLNSYK